MNKRTMYNMALKTLDSIWSLDLALTNLGIEFYDNGLCNQNLNNSYELSKSVIIDCFQLELDDSGRLVSDYLFKSTNKLFINEVEFWELIMNNTNDEVMTSDLWDIFVEDRKDLISTFNDLYHVNIYEAESKFE